MLTNRWLGFIVIVVTHIFVPLLLLSWVALGSSWLDWCLRFMLVFLALVWLSLAGYWTIFGYYLRYLWPPLAVLVGFISLPTSPMWIAQTPIGWIMLGCQLALLIGLIYQIFAVVRSYFYDRPALALSFPFREGTYGINFGGNGKVSLIMNYHYKYSANLAMAFAVDVVKLHGWGMARGWTLPANNEGFAIFQEEVLSPCAGEVVYVENQWPDHAPFSLDRPYNTGNHVILRTNGIEVLLGHLQKDSIRVQRGDQVQIGSVLGRIGNSGFSDFPHLHIQATRVTTGTIWNGTGVPILFDCKNPVKNVLIRK